MALVLVVAAGAAWEPRLLALLDDRPDTVVLKRCVDVDDLVAMASLGQADAAVVAAEAPGLDVQAVDRLRRHGVRPVAVVTAGATADVMRVRARAAGVADVVDDARLDALPSLLVEPVPAPVVTEPAPAHPADGKPVIAVWGPAGAPGRTTLAVGLGAELAGLGHPTLLVDADPYGGAVAQQLGVLEEVSGLLAAARLVAHGEIGERLGEVARGIGPSFAVLTGLPRPDRWMEFRPGVLTRLLEVARARATVVVDTGFSLEADDAEPGSRPHRNQLTLDAVAAATDLVVVGAADPVGLGRLARGLLDLAETEQRPERLHVVVNRMRPSLGWSERDIAEMLAELPLRPAVRFLPEDRAATDRGLVAGCSLDEVAPGSPLRRGIAALAALLAERKSNAFQRRDADREERSPRRQVVPPFL